MSAIGSNKADESLNIKAVKAIFIIGYIISRMIIIKPIAPMAFLMINEYPATEDIASENEFQTMGIKLSIVNLAVFIVTASIVEDVIPLTANIPI